MSLQAARQEDTEAIEAFLIAHSDTSMFLRSNLRSFGPCGGEARNATRMWLQRGSGGGVEGVLGISTAGFVLTQLPADTDDGEARDVLGGSQVKGMAGASEQVHRLRAALGLSAAAANLDEDEPLYSLDLRDLIVPAGTSTLRPATEDDRALVEAWRQAYLVETIHFTEDEAAELAPGDVDGMLERGTLMLQIAPDGEPVSMTSFNAILPDMVQIGNVYTPPESRGRGYARRCVALHLERARCGGARRAILFASGPSASRAYEAIGFRRIGSFTLLVLSEPQLVAAEP